MEELVKKLDDTPAFPPLIDHAGWRIGRLFKRWKQDYDAEMTALGHGFIAEARGAVIGHLRPSGAPQSSVAADLGISKQAVQQLIDELEAEGIVERVANPDDARAKLVMLTAKGAAALRDSNRIKREIEARYRAALGESDFAVFMAALEKLGGEGG